MYILGYVIINKYGKKKRFRTRDITQGPSQQAATIKKQTHQDMLDDDLEVEESSIDVTISSSTYQYFALNVL